MDITKQQTDGVTAFTLNHPNGLSLRMLDRGGILTHLFVPDRTGNVENVLLTYETTNQYMDDPNYMGALIGRVAGRVRQARYKTGDSVHHLESDTPDQLHGGPGGLHQVSFDVEPFEENEDVGLRLTAKLSNESGYVGTVDVMIEYRLTASNEFIIRYDAEVSERTPLTLTNHAYFNLSGDAKETIHNHHLALQASSFIELDPDLLPTGRMCDVNDTPYDFRDGKPIASALSEETEQQRFALGGIDHYFLLDSTQHDHITLIHPESGRRLRVTTTYPGLVVYTGNALTSDTVLEAGQNGAHMGICFETQHPAASLEMGELPSIWCEPGQHYEHETVYRFDNI